MSEIDDPFKPSDATILRPRPGAGRRGASDATVHHRPAPASAPQAEAVPEPSREVVGTGLSPLVQAASPLLLLASQLRGTLSVPDLSGLRRHALDEIRRFEARVQAANVPGETCTAARYVLCAGLDEAVLSTPWGAQSDWSQQPLLVALHREAWGGEKFFEMLDRVTKNPSRHVDLLELQYLCMALGFAGRYQVLPRGDTQLAEIKRELYRVIRTQRDVPPPSSRCGGVGFRIAGIG